MDTNYMCTNGLDMDQLFDKGAGTQSFGMYDTAGVDLGRRFLKGSSDFSTGFYVGSTDVARLLSSDAISIKRSNGVWHGVVGGQCNWDAGFKAGFELLDKYDMKKNEFMDLPATEYSGHPIAYRTTVWNAFRVYSLFEYPGTVLDIKFKTTDGGNGTVECSKIRTHSAYHKDFVIVGGGGDKGHYGEGVVEITLRVPGLRSQYYKGTFWINSD